jgi:hypothetical protein
VYHKRKSDGKAVDAPNLNEPVGERSSVPAGLVTDRIAQLGNASTQVVEEAELQKKQKTTNKSRAESTRVAERDPRRAQ